VRNRGVRSEVKTLIVKARRALGSGAGSSAEERASETISALRALDRAASKRILHPNNAARRKSRLARRLAKLGAAAPAPAASGKGKKAAPAAATSSSKKK
jgi:small subunit ribosomal protein S20